MPLKFAIVREDPELEAEMLSGPRKILLVASGGCTALTLARRGHSVTAFDFNTMQLAHLRAKVAACDNLPHLERLNQSGEFEGLFRILQKALEEFVAPPAEIAAYFAGDTELPRTWFRSRYWPAIFATTFNDPMLHAMFGPDATQHAEPGSYPGYFQRALEDGLLREDGPRNPFLEHILLGRFLSPPPYFGEARIPPIDIIEGTLAEVAGLETFDLFSLSNIFDWASDTLVADWGTRIAKAAHPGAGVLIRQLNNRREVTRFFPGFDFDPALGASLHARDRSLFYERILVGFKT